MLVTNDMMHDARVARHARTLGIAGYETIVVCEQSRRTAPSEDRGVYSIVRISSKAAEYARLLDNVLARSQPTDRFQEQSRLISRRKNLNWACRLALRILAIVFLQTALLKAARMNRAHIYCANDLDTLLLAVLAAGKDCKTIYDSHELWPDMLVGVPPFLKRMIRSYEKLLIARADVVVTVNEFIAQELSNRYNVRSPVNVIYNSVPSPTRVRRKPPTKPNMGAKVALYHGWYSPERGLENLVTASEFLSPDVFLVLRGAGELEAELKRLASGRRNVRFERPVSQAEVVNAASRADVGIVPYLPTNLCNYYASPNKLFEYLAAGLPIAASNLPFMRKLVSRHKIGTLFDARNPQSIAEALNQITRPTQLEMYRRNVQIARRKYTWSVESRKLLDLYAGLARGVTNA